MSKKPPVSLQKLDFTLKRLEQAIRKRIQVEEIKKSQECEKLTSEIGDLKREIRIYLNEIKMLKTIIREAAGSIGTVIEVIEKVHNQ